MAQIGRNASCPCGSGEKFKRCCGDPLKQKGGERAISTAELQKRLKFELERQQARELIRIQQQGQGRPIIATKHGGHQVVAVGNTVHFSKKWKFFTDFLFDYIVDTLGREWFAAEMAKAVELRHPILQWYEAVRQFRTKGRPEGDGNYSRPATGAIYCYLGLAYNLFLLKHNAELQAKLVARLKHADQFQGAYYELIVANALIRAGFELTIENEDSRRVRHCEFAAVSRLTGARYSVEAKMRSVAGLLGKTDGDPTAEPTDKLIKHLNDALGKESNGERLIFIDVNAEPLAPGADAGAIPAWMTRALTKLDQRESKLEPGQRAYVFVTNMAFHRGLEEETRGHSFLARGLGIADFGKPGAYTFVEAWKHKQKHADAHRLTETLLSYPQIPNSFDGDLPLPDAIRSRRVEIGRTYFFPDAGAKGMLGEVTTAIMSPETKKMHFSVRFDDGTNRVASSDVSDEEIAAYQAHPDAYFGVIRKAPRNLKTAYELFEWMVEAHKKTPKEKLLEMAKGHPDLDRWAKLDQSDIVLELCQALAARAAAEDKTITTAAPPRDSGAP